METGTIVRVIKVSHLISVRVAVDCASGICIWVIIMRVSPPHD